MTERVTVLYAGKVMEVADTSTLFKSPKHPYTEALLKAVPSVKQRGPSKLSRGISRILSNPLPDAYFILVKY